MATLALRRHDRAPLLRGLVAVILEAGDEDWRESMMTLALLHDAATRVGVDPAQVFALAAAYAHSPEIRDRFLRFLNRSERNKSAEGMRYILVEEPEGPAYRPDPGYWRTAPGRKSR